MKSDTIIISIVGPESSGKTTLAKQLAEHYKTDWVPEFARNYLEQLDRAYQLPDLIEIAKGQIKSKQEKLNTSSGNLLFLDTDLSVIRIWSEVKYDQLNDWLKQEEEKERADITFLCAPDLPWEYDALREAPSPKDRWALYNVYHEHLSNKKVNFHTVEGQGDERLFGAIEKINLFLQKKRT